LDIVFDSPEIDFGFPKGSFVQQGELPGLF
jgi:hypothetical protein